VFLEVFYIAIILICIAGWTLNIIALIDAKKITKLEKARIVGVIFLPLGIVLGYI
jgi:hypothetical protein